MVQLVITFYSKNYTHCVLYGNEKINFNKLLNTLLPNTLLLSVYLYEYDGIYYNIMV